MIPQNTDIFCIIVHYGAEQPTRQLVASLLQGSNLPTRIVVINHGPAAGEFESLDDRVQVVTPEKNEGYAAGINIGLGVLVGRGASLDSLVVCMNNDLTIGLDTIQQVDSWWKENPTPALAGIKTGAVNLLTGRATITNYKLLVTKHWSLPYLHGSFLAAPLRVFLKVHFPDTYFLYWEDVVFSRQLVQRDISLKVMSGVDIKHIEEKPLHNERLYYLVRNGALFLERHTSFPWRIYWRVRNSLRAVYHSWFTAQPKRTLMVRALRDARQNVTGKYEK